MKKGIAISPGVAVARAFRVDEVPASAAAGLVDASGLAAEIARFDAACESVVAELDVVIQRVTHEVDEESAAIFRAHRQLVRDPALFGKVKHRILSKHIDAVSALRETLHEYDALFAQIPDPYLRERMTDIRDVVGRIIAQLTTQAAVKELEGTDAVVLVAQEILPSQSVMFEKLPVAGIVTERGGTTGHAAIVARSAGIPAVSGIKNVLTEIHNGDLLVIDGREGHLLINPGPEVEAAYRKLQREYVGLRDRIISNRDQEAVTADGIRLDLLANVNNMADAVTACNVGAVGVGLYRTEYLFLTHGSVPTEDEQFDAYRQVVEAAPNRRVTIRMLDLGGDKQVPYLGSHHESNPFMGWRSIRLTSAYPEFFQTQLRAILRATRFGEVGLMLPMISTVEEVQRFRRLVERTRMELISRKIECAPATPFGIMVEVPAAAICIDQILDEVDFVSIGSNDLIQYLMAADRDNPKVAHLCEPFNPAVFRLLRSVIAACNSREKPVTLCGEMAGQPRCFLPLLGMGLRKFSMSPAFLPTIKALARDVRLIDAKQAAEQVVRMKTFTEVRSYLTQRVRELCPNVAQLDTC